MGNCLLLLLQEKAVSTVMKRDGRMIECKAPIKVHQQFSHHAISDGLNHLHPDGDMLLHLPRPTKKTVRFAEELEEEKDTGVVRIKVVISKKELQVMLAEEGLSVEDMISRMQKLPNKIGSIDEREGELGSRETQISLLAC